VPVVYDIETYPNAFTLSAIGCDTDQAATWEISDRRDDRESLVAWLHHLARERVEMVGFNNMGFDYPVVHALLANPRDASAATLYDKAHAIIHSGDRFAHTIWPSDQWIPQIDLFKIHHFDNVARSTSLKALQINMRSPSVEDLPFPPGTHLAPDDIDVLRSYNAHDVLETKRFYDHTRDAIAFRRQIGERYGRDFLNHNDTKIGKDYFVMRLEEASPGSCYQRGQNGGRHPVQTYRGEIRLRDVILPSIRFQHPEFVRVWSWFREQVITTTKGAITDVSCEVNGFAFHFGTGGIHGSVTRQHVRADEAHEVVDLDVTSYYPSIAIVNRFHPAHLGELFCDIYADVMAQRRQYPKGTPENAVLKLALNGVYGDSNNPYSPFYDPQYTMAITVNGQLLLCMLAERLMLTVPGLQMIQINTDGLTVRVPRAVRWLLDDACTWWQQATGLALEEARYAHMWIRDVNNYLAVGTDGKVKRKGAYETAPPGKRAPLGWHQDTSALVVAKAAEAAITAGADVDAWIRAHDDPFDFMCRAKAPRGSRLMHGDDQVQSTTRYYLARDGAPLTKVSPPAAGCTIGHYKKGAQASAAEYSRADNTVWNPALHTKNKSKHAERRMQICAGWNVAICNRADAFRWDNVAYDWYIAEAKKLLD
jgi:hypothetical protein